MAGIGFDQAGKETHAGPGHWNDPDMLVLGILGWGSLRRTLLTPSEQHSHMTLWCLLASPLLLGCHLDKLDAWTLSLLTNDEVLAVNQDPDGRQARRVQESEPLPDEAFGTQVWVKQLADSTLAVGLFNLGRSTRRVGCSWDLLGRSGAQPVRDLWMQQDLGPHPEGFAAEIDGHGLSLLRIGTPVAEAD